MFKKRMFLFTLLGLGFSAYLNSYYYRIRNGLNFKGNTETIDKITLFAKFGGSHEQFYIPYNSYIEWYTNGACLDGISVDHPRLGSMFTRPGWGKSKLGVVPTTGFELACRDFTAALKYDPYGDIVFVEE
ncbi:MAG: hypothetical protein K2X90_00465 [Candidatus Babeliaceae bacterium]|nr:hypothetical protein [Candidatus Babeliaceae bacterium]